VPLKSSFKKAEDSPGFLLWKASNRLQRLHAQCLAGLPVTPTQFSLMACLVYLSKDGPVTASAIVRHAGMDKMMVSDLLKSLEKKKLVQRKLNPNDGRSFLVSPTEKGVEATNSAVLKVEAFDTQFFKEVLDLKKFHANLAALAEDH
jgi:DNA-binding MarR family transcriptional regulator